MFACLELLNFPVIGVVFESINFQMMVVCYVVTPCASFLQEAGGVLDMFGMCLVLPLALGEGVYPNLAAGGSSQQ